MTQEMDKERRKQEILRWLDGQRKAQEVIEAEKARKLPLMSRAERLAAFNALCELWRERVMERQQSLDSVRIAETVEFRRRLGRASEAYKRERNR